ncbi:hypothetical protein C8J57DRAFT_1218653 [Mycena rebaudengoi]|nr:hypothetical protein C8J57DRAFT_1218653 [Mycena rebaudengoi]
MLFSASIAFTFLLSLSAVQSAPLSRRQAVVAQACSGPNGTGACIVLKIADRGPESCTNVGQVKSLILNPENSCVSLPNPDCDVGTGVASEHFSDDKGDLEDGVRSLSCSFTPGLVNGLFPQ